MASNVTIPPERFAATLNSYFQDIGRKMSDGLDEPIKQACKKAKAVARDTGTYKNRTGKYRAGFTYVVDKSGRYEAMGYVGNRAKPGLVHLLEHGHATMNGGRTREFPHMVHGEKAGADVLIKECGLLVDRSLV